METQKLSELYRRCTGKDVAHVEKIHGTGGGGRVYFRLTDTDGDTVFGIHGTNPEENEAFYNLSLLFAARKFRTPMVYGISDDRMYYLQEDLGTTTLADFLKICKNEDGSYNVTARNLLKLVISELPRMQFEGASEYIYEQCYPVPEMDEMSIMFDLNYFKYCFLKLRNIEFNEVKLENDFRKFAKDILNEMTDTFMYRDFQSRNVMIFEGKPYFIDYQGGRKGPIFYDVASFVWQASAKYPDDLKEELIDSYLCSLKEYMDIPRKSFIDKLMKFVLFRTLQVLGAYGFRGMWEKKQQFIQSIPQGLKNLEDLVNHGSLDSYPELKSSAIKLVEQEVEKSNNLYGIRVMSFSYKKGVPEDESGNGGGYIFDCRSTHNPGRYDEYKKLTGLDQPVKDFLEKDGEITTFLESVDRIVDFHVQRYQERGFNDLMICFGCTGGQHRSVYCAQHVAERIHNKFGMAVHLIHREQGIDTFLA